MDEEKVRIVMEAYERRREKKRVAYYQNRDAILDGMKKKYDALKAERLAQGIPPAKRGRPRKEVEVQK
jgi:hypothetical protein